MFIHQSYGMSAAANNYEVMYFTNVYSLLMMWFYWVHQVVASSFAAKCEAARMSSNLQVWSPGPVPEKGGVPTPGQG